MLSELLLKRCAICSARAALLGHPSGVVFRRPTISQNVPRLVYAAPVSNNILSHMSSRVLTVGRRKEILARLYQSVS